MRQDPQIRIRSRNELLDDERATISGCDCFVEYLAKFLWCGYVMDLTPSFKLSVCPLATVAGFKYRSEEHTSELQSRFELVCRLLLHNKNRKKITERVCI